MRLTRVTLFFIALIIAVGFYLLIDLLLKDLESQTLQATEETMVDVAHLLANFVENDLDLAQGFTGLEFRELGASIFSLTKVQPGLNAYLTDRQGIVLFDSAHPENIGRDFSQWRDVHRTLRGDYGARSTRTNPDDDRSSIMFVGAPVRRDGEIIGCLSVYKPQSDVLPFVDHRRQLIIWSTALIGTGILGLIGAVFIWLFRPVGQLTDYARAITRGERRPRPKVGSGREVNTLANALHEMREALDGRSYTEHYLQTLTHELKSPLAAIQGAAELLQEDMPPADRTRFLTNIQNQTRRCETLIHQLLELSAIESKSHLEDSRRFDLAACARRCLAATAPLAEAAGVKLTGDLPDTLEFHGNEALIASALNHLLQNAIQFSPSSGRVTLAAGIQDDHLHLTVTDEGTGIPDFAADRAFERFYSYRPDQADKAGSKGNGIGLTLVKEVAELHRGQATITRRETGGTLCTLRLPWER